MLIQIPLRLLKQPLMHLLQQLGHRDRQLRQRHRDFLAVVPAHTHALPVFNVSRSQLQPHRNAFHLPLGALPPHRVVRIIHPRPDARAFQCVQHLRRFLQHAGQPRAQFLGLFQHAGLMLRHRHHNDLDRRDLRRQHQPIIVPMGHNDTADHPGRHAPACLMGMVQLIITPRKRNVECSRKTIAEVMTGAALQGLFIVHHALHGVSLLSAVEFLLIGLAPFHHRHGEEILQKISVDIQHPLGLFPGLVLGSVHGVASCHKNSRCRKNGRDVFSQRSTLHHWL